MEITKENINQFIDHTNVKPDATREEIKKLCDEALKYRFCSVCVSPYRIKDAQNFLKGDSAINIIAVIGFPFGWASVATKINEAKEAIAAGATEIDMVINIGAVKESGWDDVKAEITQIVKNIAPVGLKVIIEVSYLSNEEIIQASKVVQQAGAEYVKTGTGYGPRETKINDIKLIRQALGEEFKIKAAGGIRDFETAKAMIEAGATRIGTSAGLAIIGQGLSKTVDLSGSNE